MKGVAYQLARFVGILVSACSVVNLENSLVGRLLYALEQAKMIGRKAPLLVHEKMVAQNVLYVGVLKPRAGMAGQSVLYDAG